MRPLPVSRMARRLGCQALLVLVTILPRVARAGDFLVGSFTKTTSAATVSQVVSHSLGQTPRAILLWTNGKTNESIGTGFLFGLGMSDGTTSKALAASSTDGVGTSLANRRMASKVLTIVDGAGTTLAEADLASWSSSSFTLSWTTNDSTAYVVHYLLISGPHVSAKVLGWTMAVATGSQSITGVGFQPDLILMAHVGAAHTASLPSTSANTGVSISMANAAGESAATCSFSQSASGTTSTHRYQRAGKALIAATNVLTKEATLTSMDSDGFTLNYSTANASAGQMITLALAGVRSAIGSFTKPTGAAPATDVHSGLDFQPRAVLFASAQNTTNATFDSHTRLGFGATDRTTSGCSAFQDADALDVASVDGVDKTSSTFVKVNNDTETIDAVATLSSLDPTGFTLSWTPNDAVATEILYLALAPPRRVIVVGSAR